MFALRQLRHEYPSYITSLSLLCCLACKSSTEVDLEASTGTNTSGSPTASEAPTTGAGGDGIPTTTTATTTTGSNDEEPGTSSSGADTTGGLSGCGDGIVDANEECDDGAAGNADDRFCKKDCKLNVCGDGQLFVGWELCDEGIANSDEYGSLCGSQCMPGARCGDHKLQAEFETCDLGPGNGTAKGDEQGILCDVSCRAEQLRGFVTKDVFTGNLGGLGGADLKCRTAAEAAGLPQPERFRAYLSTGDLDAKDRFEKVATSWPYVLVTGKKFADNFPTLVEAGPLGEGIMVTETGVALYDEYVATNTDPGGIKFSPDQHCQAWTSADALYKARVGVNGVSEAKAEWSDWQKAKAWVGATDFHCDKTIFHLYCLEM